MMDAVLVQGNRGLSGFHREGQIWRENNISSWFMLLVINLVLGEMEIMIQGAVA